jgi:hypothetical protein
MKMAAVVGSALLIAACGGGDGDDAAAQNPGTNQAPSISGTPATTVMQSTPYSFTPSATDPNGDTLTFSITGKPAWAAFDATTGKLSGTPGSGDVANYANIQISVSDGVAAAVSLAAFSINTANGAATLTWTPPSTNTDGSALTDLAGYRIYWGTAQNGPYPNSEVVPSNAGATAVIDQLTPATWYFVVTAYDVSGNESVYSNVASKTVL